MSAYIVDRNHIMYLIAAACSRSISRHGASWYHNGKQYSVVDYDHDRCAEVGNMLYEENVKSVSARYPNESVETLPGPIVKELEFKPKDFARGHWDRFDPVQVLQSCACYEYQSCEHEGWKTSEAYAFIKSLKSSAIHSLPGMDKTIWGAPEKSSGNSISLMSLVPKR